MCLKWLPETSEASKDQQSESATSENNAPALEKILEDKQSNTTKKNSNTFEGGSAINPHRC